MYHCHTRFYLAGHHCRAFEIIRKMSPLERFTHEFMESGQPDDRRVRKADVIFVALTEGDGPELLQSLLMEKISETELILLASQEQIRACVDKFSGLGDIWPLPMSDEEICFRFRKWQKTHKMRMDFWEINHFFEATINNVPNLVWYKDKEGIHEKVNDSFCRTVGKTKTQVEGQGHAYIWDVEQDDPACIESERIVMESKKTCVSEERIQTGEGERLLTTYKSPLYNLDGSVMGTVGVAIDVTQERAYEQEIVNKNHTLETIFTTIDCGVMRHTLDGSQILSVNRAALKILGYESKEELMADGFNMIAHSVVEEDREKLRSLICSLKREGDSVSVEYRVQHKNGEILHIMGNIKLLRENGELCYQRFLLDCTEQKMQEKKNEKRQAGLIQALSTDYNLVCYFDLETGRGNPLRNDGSNGDMFATDVREGLSFEDSLEQYIQKFVYEEDRELLREFADTDNLKQELAEKNSHYVNYRIVLNREIKYFQIKVVRVGVDDQGYGIVLGLRSVDEEIRNEMEKKSLLEDALMQANRANKAKSVFLSNMSHDIRTPMNAIVGFTALALTHISSTEQVEEYLKKIMTSGNHLLSLINDILDMSRIESGKITLEEKPCSLPDILHSLRNILQADVRAKQLELYMDAVDVMDEEICCDRLRVNQVLLNLLSNAIKYTEAGGIISVRVMERPGAPAGYANYEFYIKDTGIGMSKEFVSHIFEPFERESTSTISGIQGTGLGMAITKNIVDMMNGTIEVKSEQGVGTEVRVCFTFQLCSGVRKVPAIPKLKGCRALVVDDDFNTCDSVSYMLQQIGLRAEWTLSGREAVLRTRQAVTRGDNYSVYIIDWLLPDMNGVEITRRIRKEMGEDVAVIVLTAYDWSDIEEEAKEAGVTAFCSKPLFLSELRECLYSIVNTDEIKEEESNTETEHIYTGRILLAEDNELNQEIATAILSDAGFTTEVAENGQIAVDMLLAAAPDYYQLVLMDVQMPVMNGYEATKKIRSLENRKLASIPILAMTANAFEEDKQEALRCGMNGHIAKPINIETLFETLDQVLGIRTSKPLV
ncbi:MAG: response regulator [Lachnospiraceae bacterium]|jgi:PAS domain S-box-containing protein|nr:response regulator [Lachnospiraceae bacterium]